jgi:hypothetical protein
VEKKPECPGAVADLDLPRNRQFGGIDAHQNVVEPARNIDV